MVMMIPVSDDNCAQCAKLVIFFAVVCGGSLFISCIYKLSLLPTCPSYQ